MPHSISNDAVVSARLSSLLDTAMDAIISVDESQRIVIYNRAAEKVFGWSSEDALGKPLSRLNPERFHAMHALGVRRFGAAGVTSRRVTRERGGVRPSRLGRGASGGRVHHQHGEAPPDFQAVGFHYASFPQVDDAEVVALLRQADPIPAKGV